MFRNAFCCSNSCFCSNLHNNISKSIKKTNKLRLDNCNSTSSYRIESCSLIVFLHSTLHQFVAQITLSACRWQRVMVTLERYAAHWHTLRTDWCRELYTRRDRQSFQVATDRLWHWKTTSRNSTGRPRHADHHVFLNFRIFTVRDWHRA